MAVGETSTQLRNVLHVLGFVQPRSAPWPTEKRYVTKTGVTVMRGGGEYAFAARGCTSESAY